MRGASLEAQNRAADAAARVGGYANLVKQPAPKKVMRDGKPLMAMREGKVVFVYEGEA